MAEQPGKNDLLLAVKIVIVPFGDLLVVVVIPALCSRTFRRGGLAV